MNAWLVLKNDECSRELTFLDPAGRDAVVDLLAEDTEDILTAWTTGHATLRVDDHRATTRLARAVEDVRHRLERRLQQEAIIAGKQLRVN